VGDRCPVVAVAAAAAAAAADNAELVERGKASTIDAKVAAYGVLGRCINLISCPVATSSPEAAAARTSLEAESTRVTKNCQRIKVVRW